MTAHLTTVWVTHRFVGHHNWPDAPPHRAYLRDQHRHVFHVRVEVPVTHDDRDIEFHDLLSAVEAACMLLGTARNHTDPAVVFLDSMSCEQIAVNIAHTVRNRWDHVAFVSCEVSEDGENGATYRWDA